MSQHAPGAIVRLNREKSYEGTTFPSGTLGTVVAPISSLGAVLVLLGHDTTTRLVPVDHLDGVLAAATKPRSRSERRLRYVVGDRVELKEERVFGDVVYPQGSPGTVAAVLESFGGYLIDFDQDSTDRLLPDSALV